jgi:hypothetical protein
VKEFSVVNEATAASSRSTLMSMHGEVVVDIVHRLQTYVHRWVPTTVRYVTEQRVTG